MMVPAAGEVRTWLNRRWNVIVPDDWLEACLSWIQEENAGVLPSADNIKRMVYDQWLLSDLRELGCACLPSEVLEHKRYELSGHFCLQVDSLVDVSTPFYSQLQKVQGTENANALVNEATQATQPPWQAKSHRMLMLTMTDGVQDVQGMEYKPIPTLSPEILPGTKVQIHGTVLCRMGILMLTRDNITVLGGEVDALLEDNKRDKAIERSLRQNVELATNPPEMPKREFSEDISTQHGTNKSRPGTQQTVRGRQPQLQQRQQQQQPQQRYGAAIKPEPAGDDMEDDDLMEHMDVAALDALEQQWDNDDDMDYEAIMEEMDTQMSNQPVETQQTWQNPSQFMSSGFSSAQPPPSRAPQTHTQDRFSAMSRSTKPSQPPFGRSAAQPSTHQSGPSVRPGLTHASSSSANSSTETSFKKELPKTNFTGSSMSDRTNRSTPMAASSQPRRKPETPSHVTLGMRNPIKAEPGSSQMAASQTPKLLGKQTSQPRSKPASKLAESSSVSFPSSVKQPRLDNFFTKSAKKTGSRTLEMDLQGRAQRDEPVVISDFSDEDDISASPSVMGARGPALDKAADDEFERNVMEMMEDAEFEDGWPPDESEMTAPRQQPALASPETGLHRLPWTYLSEVNRIWPPKERTVIRIKGYFAAIIGKLECNEGSRWSLPVQVNDGSASLDADLSDGFLTSLIGFTASSCMMMRNAAKVDKSIRIQMAQGVKNCQKKIVAISRILEMELCPSKQRPCVLRQMDPTPQDLQHLKHEIQAAR